MKPLARVALAADLARIARGGETWPRPVACPAVLPWRRFDSPTPSGATGPLDDAGRRSPRLARLEAVLLLAREPLSSRKLSQYANLADGTEARTLIRQLNHHYDARGRSWRVEQTAGGYRLLTRPKFASWLRRLGRVPSELRLSSPALETLAVIAYRQPVLRADIEAIRGVNCGEILRQLMDRDLVRISGRSEELGRPYLYSTTRKFLEVFGLPGLDDLPRAAMLRGVGAMPAAQPAPGATSESSPIHDSLEVRQKKENAVTATATWEQFDTDELSRRGSPLVDASIAAELAFSDEDEDDIDDDEEGDDLEDDDFDDEEDDLEDDEEDDDLEDDDLEEAEWEEVDDEEDDDLDDDEDDEDWEDDDEDWEDDDEEEEEELDDEE